MTYVNTIEGWGVFSYLRVWLVNRCISYRALFCVNGA
jgi:hypothetical protein